MKNMYTGLITSLISVGFIVGMDLVVELDIAQKKIPGILKKEKKIEYDMSAKIWPITQCCDILNMPIKDIRSSVERLSYSQQEKLRESLASSFTFALAMLPKELCLYILHKAYDEPDDCHNNGISFFCTPIIEVVTQYTELCNNPITIGTKKISLNRYLALSPEEINRMRSIVNPSQLSRLFEGTSESVVSQEDYNVVIQILPDDVDGIRVLPSYSERLRLGLCGDHKICKTTRCLFLFGILGIAQIPLCIGRVFHDNGHYLPSIIFYVIGGGLEASILLGAAWYGISRWRDYVVTQAQNNLVVQE